MEVAVILVGGTDTVRLGTLPDLAGNKKASAPAAGAASAVGIRGKTCLFKGDNNGIRCLCINHPFVGAEANAYFEAFVFVPLGIERRFGDVGSFAIFFLAYTPALYSQLCKLSVKEIIHGLGAAYVIADTVPVGNELFNQLCADEAGFALPALSRLRENVENLNCAI